MDASESKEPGDKRGRARDAEATREAILDAGESVFAQHGFDGARIDSIAEASGYNKSLIFQYFEDKLGLYAAVIRRADDQMRGWQGQAIRTLQDIEVPLQTDKLRDMVQELIGWYFDYLVDHPNVLRIFNWELAEGWQTFSKIVSERDYADIEDFTPIFQKMEAAHLMRSEPSAFLQWTAGLFTSHVLLAVVPLYRVMLPGEDFDSPSAIRKMRDFAVDFIIGGLLIGPGSRNQPRSTRRSGDTVKHEKTRTGRSRR